MLSIGAVGGAGAASRYYSKDDYYTREGDQHSGWLGRGAAELGLTGPVDKDVFQQILEGHVPGTDERIGAFKDGEFRHQAGWDLTLSAPKSVSIMAEVMGDDRLIEAHDKAVRDAIALVEDRHIKVDNRAPDGGRTHETTGKLVAGTFRHDLSREKDPQLHTHVVVANMTHDGEKWRGIVARDLYLNAKTIGIAYQQTLALEVQRLGYDITLSGNGTFELKGVDRSVAESFSTRRAQIEERLKDLGKAPEDASHRTRAGVALTTRAQKEAVDRDVAIEAWRGALSESERVSLDGAKSAAEERTTEARQESVEAGRSSAAQAALTDAVAHLSERNAAFTVGDLRAKANAFALGRADRHDVERALGRARDTGQTIDRDVVLPDRIIGADMRQDGLTTQEARAHEAAILGREQAGRGAVKPLATERQADRMIARFERESARQGFSWTEGQRDSLKVLLTARDQVTGIQGLAGTAKTTTVLANYAAMSAKRGLTITALAPTHAAANELGHALGVTGRTVDQHLADLSSGKSKVPEASAEEAKTTTKGKIWVVDEAGMASVTQMRGILDKAAENDARVVLVGDVKQLGAVGPGAAFLQLQKAGMLTGRLEEIVRQKATELLKAVETSSGTSPAATIAYFKNRPLQTIEAKDVETRRTAIADKWLALGPAEREKTLVIEPSREGRDEVTQAIRAGLVREGTLDGNEVKTSRLERRDMSGPERKRAEYYRPGDKLTFSRAYTFDGARVPAGELLTITDRDASKGGVGLRRDDGTSFKWHPTAKGSDRVQVFQVKSDDLRGGDRIQWTDNSKALGLHNGRKGEVLAVDPERQTVEVRFGKETRTLDLKDPAHKHWRHAYVQTVYQAQGKTSERVIFHAPSNAINLTNQPAFYVALSRAKSSATLVTDNLDRLGRAISARAGINPTALTAEASRDPVRDPASGASADQDRARSASAERLAGFKAQLVSLAASARDQLRTGAERHKPDPERMIRNAEIARGILEKAFEKDRRPEGQRDAQQKTQDAQKVIEAAKTRGMDR